MNTAVELPDAIEPDEVPDAIEPDEVIEPELVEPDAPESEQALARQSTDLVSTAKALQIADVAAFERAGGFLQTLKDKQRQIEEFFAPDIERAHAAWKGLTTKRASYIDPIKEAITIVSSRYAAFAQEVKRKAEAERRERELAAQRAEQERLRKEAEAREAEARRLAAEAEHATSRQEALALEEQASALTSEAESLKVEAAEVQAPVLAAQPSVTTPKGTSVRANWTYEVTDKLALIKAVADGKVSHEAIEISSKYLNARAKADKDTIRVPGVRFFDAGSVAVSRRR
jgi:hypothetical protein